MSCDAHSSVLERRSHSALLKYIIFILISLSQCLSKAEIRMPIALGMSSRRRRKRCRHCSIPKTKSTILALLLGLGIMARLVMIVNSDRWRRMAMKTQRSWKRRDVVVRRSWRSCTSRGLVTQVVGASYDDRAAVLLISREGVTQKSCRVTATQSIIKVTGSLPVSVTEASRRSRSVFMPLFVGPTIWMNPSVKKTPVYFPPPVFHNNMSFMQQSSPTNLRIHIYIPYCFSHTVANIQEYAFLANFRSMFLIFATPRERPRMLTNTYECLAITL